MRIYIAGPMRGIPLYNFPAFDAARDLLGSLGHDPVSPADMDREIGFDEYTATIPPTFVRDALRRDFGALLGCEAIALLPGWETSSGAQSERRVADAIGLPAYRVAGGAFYRESTIGIAGYARSGKDTLARFVAAHGYEQRSFAAPMKAMLYALNPVAALGHQRLAGLVDGLGWEGAKQIEEVRALLQRLGTDAGRRHLGDAVWVEALLRTPSAGRIVVSDVRFPNEADALRARGGIVVRVTRPGVEAVNDHPSEHALDDYGFDLVVANEGSVEDLKRAADHVVELA